MLFVLSCEWTVLLSNLDLSNKEYLKKEMLFLSFQSLFFFTFEIKKGATSFVIWHTTNEFTSLKRKKADITFLHLNPREERAKITLCAALKQKKQGLWKEAARRNNIQSSHAFLNIKFKEFSKTFLAQYLQIQGLNNGSFETRIKIPLFYCKLW